MPDPTHSKQWPGHALTAVPACPTCGSLRRTQSHAALVDQLTGDVPGSWMLFDCRECGSAWLDPRPSDDFLGLAYEGYYTHKPSTERVIVRRKGLIRRTLHDIVNGYLALRFGVQRSPRRAGWLLYFLPPLRATCDAMCRHLPVPRTGAKLLDVGCGNGEFLQLARQMGWDAEGLDFDEDAVVQARSHGFDVTVGGVESIANRKGVYDAITSSHVLEHVANPVKHLRTLYSLLKPGGLLWLQTPNVKGLGSKLYGRHWRGLEPPRHLVLFNGSSLCRVLAEAGFVDVRIKPDFGQAFIVLRASEAIKRGRSVEESSANKSRLPFELAAELVEWLVPSSREFLTIMCRKPEA